MASKKHRLVIGDGNIIVPPENNETVLIDQNFDDWNLGQPTSTYWNSKWNPGGSSGDSGQMDSHNIVANPEGGRMMRVLLLANSDGTASGTGMNIPFAPQTRVKVSYRFRFTSTVSGGTFDLGGGGKTPGPGGHHSSVPSSDPTGGNYPGDWSFCGRQMWVTKKTYSSRSNGEGLFYYAGYDQSDKTDDGPGTSNRAYAQNIYWGLTNVITVGVWHTIEITYQVNDVGVANGIIKTVYDGKTVVSSTTKQMRNRSDVFINKLYWHWFLGGSGVNWEVPENQWVDVDWMRVVTWQHQIRE